MTIDPPALVRVSLAALLLILVPGCADGGGPMTRGGDAGPFFDGGGMCGAQDQPCCGAGFCNGGLACVAGSCMASTCGGELMACCAMGAPCGPGLMCFGEVCMPEADGGAGGDCGMTGGPCCATTPSCGVGLTCIAGSCREAGGTDCGATGQVCCPGDSCNTGSLCVDGYCRMEVPIPMCQPLGGSCGTTPDCCEGSCQSGTCTDAPPPPPPPPPDDRCAAFSCYDCTLLENCGFCDGTCIYTTNPDSAPCVSFQWTILECF